jgi:vacuolar-type H+-ATPase subunit H
MNRDLRASALLATIDEFRRTRCDECVAAARTEARRLRREAHAAARTKVRAVLAEERARLEAEVASREARLQTERRLAAQRGVSALLGEAWPRLRAAVNEAWATPGLRRAWTSRQIAAASALLPGQRWRIRHAPGLGEEERKSLAQVSGVRNVEWLEDSTLSAGFAIEADHNVLDATFEGLLAERAALEARLLVLLEEAKP